MNTYQDDPARGLSKLQKDILLWARRGYEHYIALGYPDMVSGENAHGAPWDLRPPFGDADVVFTGGTARRKRGDKSKKKPPGEAAAASRALKRLETRGLVKIKRYHGRTSGVRLTEQGARVVDMMEASKTVNPGNQLYT